MSVFWHYSESSRLNIYLSHDFMARFVKSLLHLRLNLLSEKIQIRLDILLMGGCILDRKCGELIAAGTNK